MDHHRPRPGLPGSTPAPAPGKTSVYQTTALPHFTEKGFSSRQAQVQRDVSMDGEGVGGEQERDFLAQLSITSSLVATQYRKSQERAINRIVAGLPYQLRDSVSSLMNMTLSASEIAQKNYEISHHELIDLRNELSKKNVELEVAQKTVTIYRAKLRGMSESMDTLKDDLDTKQKHALRNQKYLSRLSSTNKMLIGSLNALNVEPPSAVSRSADKKSRAVLLRPMSYNNNDTGDATAAQAQIADALPSKPSSPSTQGRSGHLAPPPPLLAPPTNVANERLRASLLRVAREHYLSQKLSEGLERKVDQLRHQLRDAETKCRQLQNELNELRSVHSGESGGAQPSKSAEEATQRVESAVKVRSYGKIDDRFKACMKRETLTPEAGLLTVRRIMELFSHAPLALTASQLGPFLASKEANRIFDTEVICLFLKQPSSRAEVDLRVPLNARPVDVHRYSMRSDKPEAMTIMPKARGEGHCLAHECFLTGHPARSNNLHRVGSYDAAVDVCTGVVATRIMSVPLRHIEDSSCLGVLHFINKAEAFSEADELMALIFADCTAALLTQSMALDRTRRCMHAYRRLLEMAVLPYAVIPDANMVAAEKALGPAEVLVMLEEVCRAALKCQRSRAFLVHAAFAGEEDEAAARGQLLMLTPSAKRGRPEVVSVSDSLGIAGHVATSRHAYHVEDASQNERLNPQIDLEVLGEPVYSFPVIDLDGLVLAVIQLTPSALSPKMVTPLGRSENPEDQLSFPQSAQWLAFQLCPPLRHVLDQLRAGGKPVPPCVFPLVFAERRVAALDPSLVSARARGTRRQSVTGGDASGSVAVAVAAAAAAAASAASAAASAAAQEAEALRAQLAAALEAASTAAAAASQQQQKLSDEAQAQAAASQREVAALQQEQSALRARVSDAERLAQAAVDSAVDLADEAPRGDGDGDSDSAAAAEAAAAAAASAARLAEQAAALLAVQSQLAAAQEGASQARARAEAAEAAEADKLAALAALRQEADETNAALIAATERCTLLQTESDALSLSNATTAAELAGAQHRTTELQADIDALHATVEQKDGVIAIIQEQLVKMAEDSIAGLDLSALRDSLAASVAAANAARPSTGSPQHSASASALGAGAGAATASAKAAVVARAPSGSRPPTEGQPNLAASLVVCEYPWTELVDDAGNVYYFNSETQESSWDPPSSSAAAPGGVAGGDSLSLESSHGALHGDWLECFTDEGVLYYLNQVTGESQWELPPTDTEEGV